MINNLDDLPTLASISMTPQKKYDVFISFRGVDTRSNFTSHLYNALKNSGIETYIDDRLVRGDEISSALMDAIDQSKFCAVVFSQNYAYSSWCLDELVCVEKKNLILLPIFYHVDPSDVRNQKKIYEDAFKKNTDRFPEDKIKEWRVALTTAANHSGWDASNFRLLDKLETTLLSLAQVFGDAEQKQIKNPRVEKWLDKLQDAVDDAVDLFEEIEYDALKVKVEVESEPNKSKVSKFFSNFNWTIQKTKIVMEKILERLDTFEKQRYKLDLRADVEKIQSQKPSSISSIDDSEFFGRDDDKKFLKEMMLSDEVVSEKICVIPIVGLGGIGKTTLAQAVYNDGEVKMHFELKAWVCVSDEFDVCKVTKIVLGALTRAACDDAEDLNVLLEDVQEILDKKKFLIVLDDVWNEEYNFWDTIRMLFKGGAQGSKIIVTTRSEKVARIVGTTGFHHLDVLKEESCIKLFVKIVSGNEEFTTTDSNLGRIGKELVNKCKGLPLAVKAVASLLRSTNVKEWKRIAESDILDLPGEKNILPALRLSYHYLPPHLKRCFVYFSLFPKDYTFGKEKLVSLWMVDNLLEHSSGNRTMEEVGYEYFDELRSRSFFQPANGTGDRFLIHDLMVDLANFVSQQKFVYMEKDKMYDIGLTRQIQHITFLPDYDFHETYKLISEATQLRTFMSLTCHDSTDLTLSSNTLHYDVLKDIMKLRRLRFLSLEGYKNVSKVIELVGELRHLRYLDLTRSSIKELPTSVCLLYNLQTLKLSYFWRLTKLPKNLHHLINLRHLYMSNCGFCTLPPLGQLPALLTLSIERCYGVKMVGVEFYGIISSSKSFPLLESLKFIGMILWKEWSLPKANIEAFPKLISLTIHKCWELRGDLPPLLPSLAKLDIRECWRLASSLPLMPTVRTVSINHCHGVKSCNSLQTFDNLEDLHLIYSFPMPHYFGNIDFLLTYNYKSLQNLYLYGISTSLKLLPLDIFPDIRNLRVRACRNLESFSVSKILISLSTLTIEGCHNFTLLPDSILPCLRQLVIRDCPKLESLPRSWLLFSLRELTILSCNKVIASRKNWNLQALPNLTRFCIGYYDSEDMESFLEPGSLPTSLTYLEIDHFDCLKTLDEKGFGELKSLKELKVYMCPQLQSLPVKGLPPFFEGLLQPSFERFVMYGCPLLKEKYWWKVSKCMRERGLYWEIVEYDWEICCIPQPQATMCRIEKRIGSMKTIFGRIVASLSLN
ncbi:putative disease resistance RPP13-like protein 1 isoform X2 [Humulus lupulus]|uniref:putative disease resistance RPP13-like protein 1 isoform X2 n=1 Tax=Humulus lupulus TaxID=3486 RepID=UPI002B414C97|nr:putative disease resistance RPP13-like protein 1 isoform X2 [Humulus lupulus]